MERFFHNSYESQRIIDIVQFWNIANERVRRKVLDSVYREITLKSGKKKKNQQQLGIKIVLEEKDSFSNGTRNSRDSTSDMKPLSL